MNNQLTSPLITVLIPIYNTKDYIKEAVDSILAQKEFVKQIVLVNDGSTDGTDKTIEELYGEHEIVKILHTENKGQGHARNIGTKLATGEFIYYFDSDDIADENLFREFYSALSENPKLELFCFSGKSFLDKDALLEDISKTNYLNEDAYKRKIEATFSSGEDAFNALVEKKTFFAGPPLYIFKKKLLEKYNLKFEHIKYEDEEFTHRLFIYAGLTHILDKVLFRRRVRSGSTMQINRTFDDLLGYFKTVETLSELKEIGDLKEKTKETIEQRIKTFVQLIIDLKIIHRMKLTPKERKEFRARIYPHLKKNSDLLFHNYFYPVEYNLRLLKKRVLG